MAGIRNTLSDLNNHLFAQLERLSEEDLSGEALQEEITRAKAITDVAQKIISNASVVLEAYDRFGELGNNGNTKRKGELSRLFLPEYVEG
jgi:hypothetical protein